MLKVITLFYHAEEPEALEDYFYNHYLPLVMKVPGLIKVEITQLYSDLKKVFTKSKDLTPVYKIQAELYFEDLEAFEAAFKTPEGTAVADNTIKVAWELVTCMLGDLTVITPEEYEKNPTFIRRFSHNRN